MALVEFQNNTAPYLNADNLNNNFNYLDGKNDYSTDEIVIGKWIDSKPVYRKVLEFNFNDRNYITQDLSSLNFDKVVSIYGISNTNPIEQDYYVNDGDFLRTYIDDVKTLHINIGTLYPTIPLKVFVIIEYTKTTDEGDE